MKNCKQLFVVLLIIVLMTSMLSTLASASSTAAITLSQSSGGSLVAVVFEGENELITLTPSVSSANVNYDTNYKVSVTATPDSGYTVSSITIGGVQKTNSQAGVFTATETSRTDSSLSISAVFTQNSTTNPTTTFTLTTNCATESQISTKGGSVTAGGNYAGGEQVKLTAIANKGYSFAGWTCSSGSLSSTTSKETVFTMPAENCTVSAKFVEAQRHNLTLSTPTGGKICISDGTNSMTSVTSGQYYPGEVIRLVSQADTGYALNYWYTNGQGSLISRYWYATDFEMPDCDVTVSAGFVKTTSSDTPVSTDTSSKPTDTEAPNEADIDDTESTDEFYIITIDKTTGGNVSCSTNTAKAGDVISLVAEADDGYTFSGWVSTSGGGFSNPKGNNTTFTMPASDTTIVATFTNDSATVVTEDDNSNGTTPTNPSQSFPWVWIGTGVALIALIIGAIAVIIDRRHKDRDEQQIDHEYLEDSESLLLSTTRNNKKKPAIFGRKRNNFEPEEDEDMDYNDSFFDDFE